MEYIQSVDLLAGRNEFDRLAYRSLDGESGTATGVTVHLGEHNSVEIKHIIECARCLHGILTGHRIHHEENLGRIHSLLDGGNLVHHLLVHGQTSRRIDNDH